MKRTSLILYLVVFAFVSCKTNQPQNETSLKELDETIEVIAFPKFDLKIQNYCLEADEEQTNFFIIKENLLPTTSGYDIDSDTDGLSDIFEGQQFKLSLNHFDSHSVLSEGCSSGDSPCVRDLILVLLGSNQDKALKIECPAQGLSQVVTSDEDQDGLNHCEEFLIGTKDELWDSDMDSIPDEVEIRFGLNPNFKDALLDTDGDGYNNLYEVKKNSPIDSFTSFEANENDPISSRQNSLYESVSFIEKTNSEQPNQKCFEIEIKQLPYLKSIEHNHFSFYFIINKNNKEELKQKIKLIIKTQEIISQKQMQYDYNDILQDQN